jgi:4-hydroxy-tetrahydrodipicolinate synthase
MELGRLLTAIATPFDSNLQVDYARFRELANRLIDEGAAGLVVCGTTGESPTLTHEEKIRLFREAKDAVGSRAAIVANTGTYNTAESVALTKEAAALGVDGIMAVVPYYSKPTQDGMEAHFTAIAAAAGLPLIMYNIPGRTGVMMSAETTIRLSRVPNIAGVKDACGSLEYTTAVAAGVGEGFRIWSGDDSMTLPILAVGGYGVIAVTSHIAGPKMKAMIEAHLAGDTARAASLHQRLGPLMKALFSVSNPIGLKVALREAGFDCGGLRLPLTWPSAAQVEVIRAALEAHRST